MCSLADSKEDKILKDLQEKAESRPSQNYISTFDLICFTQQSDVRGELSEKLDGLAPVSLDRCMHVRTARAVVSQALMA